MSKPTKQDFALLEEYLKETRSFDNYKIDNMIELQIQVVQWAEDRGLLTDVTAERIEKQTLKVLEEIGETAGAYLKGNREELIDGIGDIAVTLIILSKMAGASLDREWVESSNSLIHTADAVSSFKLWGHSDGLNYAWESIHNFAELQDLDLEDCLQSAYDVISKRTGKLVGDTFIKDK